MLPAGERLAQYTVGECLAFRDAAGGVQVQRGLCDQGHASRIGGAGQLQGAAAEIGCSVRIRGRQCGGRMTQGLDGGVVTWFCAERQLGCDLRVIASSSSGPR